MWFSSNIPKFLQQYNLMGKKKEKKKKEENKDACITDHEKGIK